MKHTLFCPEVFIDEMGAVDIYWDESFRYVHDDANLREDDRGEAGVPASELLDSILGPFDHPKWVQLARLALYMRDHPRARDNNAWPIQAALRLNVRIPCQN